MSPKSNPDSSRLIAQTLADHEETVTLFRGECSGVIAEMGQRTIASLRAGGKICFFGNGGSAADAQHFATEFVVRYTRNRKALPALAFTTDTSTLTACANDFGFDTIFARQVEAHCGPHDVVVGISTSGNSPNVVAALDYARTKGISSFAFTGKNGRQCAELADLSLRVPSEVTARIQECHLIAGHLICDLAETAFADQVSTITSRSSE